MWPNVFGACSKFWGGGRVGGLRTCHPPYHHLDFQGKIKNFCDPTLQKIRSKITVTPQKKKGQSQNYGASINSKFTFQNHFQEILGRCNTRYHRIRLLVSKKWGPSPSTILQIYKQCVRPIFECDSISTITTSDTIISKIQWLQNKTVSDLPCIYQNTSV